MPKKTRKEKLLAQQRRQVTKPSFSPPSNPVVSTQASAMPSFQYNATVQSKINHTTAIDTQELQTIKTDLLKTILFAMLAIGTEIGIYWQLAKR